MITIIRSFSIKCNFTGMPLFKIEDEAFVIYASIATTSRHVTFNVYTKSKMKKRIGTAETGEIFCS